MQIVELLQAYLTRLTGSTDHVLKVQLSKLSLSNDDNQKQKISDIAALLDQIKLL